MSSSFDDLPRDLYARAKDVAAGMTEILRGVSLTIHTALVVNTPVDTGKARSNWLVSLNTPLDYTIVPYYEGHDLGIEETDNADAAFEQAVEALEQLRPNAKDTVYIVNNVPYIKRLNDGWSDQSPVDFVQIAFDAADEYAAEVRIFPNA